MKYGRCAMVGAATAGLSATWRRRQRRFQSTFPVTSFCSVEASTIFSQAGTCGVEFSGWTGGEGQTANGWTRFPGTGQGLWKASVNYIGRPQFGVIVDVVGGNFDLLLTNGTVVSGNVGSGMITWPAGGATTGGCGTDEATVSVNVGFTHGVAGGGLFVGCLHDLPAEPSSRPGSGAR